MTAAVTVVLEKGQLHPGMSVFLVNGGVCIDGDGDQPLWVKVLRGHDRKLRLYPPGKIQQPWIRSGRGAIARGFHDVRSFLPDIGFAPREVFTPKEAPPDTEYLVDVAGLFLRYQDGRESEMIHLLKSATGIKITECFSHWCPKSRVFRPVGKEFELPEQAVLVPISEEGRPSKRQEIWDF